MQDSVRVYFDTMLYLNKFRDAWTVKPETSNMFSKVKSGEFRLIISQLTFVEMYHVMCLPLLDAKKQDEASQMFKDINEAYAGIKETILKFPNTEIVENEFNNIDTKKMTTFVENVPGSSLVNFIGLKKLPGSMDFIHLMTASNLKCKQFITNDNGVVLLDSYAHKGDMKIIRPYKA